MHYWINWKCKLSFWGFTWQPCWLAETIQHFLMKRRKIVPAHGKVAMQNLYFWKYSISIYIQASAKHRNYMGGIRAYISIICFLRACSYAWYAASTTALVPIQIWQKQIYNKLFQSWTMFFWWGLKLPHETLSAIFNVLILNYLVR